MINCQRAKSIRKLFDLWSASVLLWEYLLTNDEQLDLAKLEQAREWFLASPWSYDEGLGWWTPRAQSNWKRNLLALRSLACRLKGRRTARPGRTALADDLRADQVLFEYVRMLRPVPTFLETAGTKGLSPDRWCGIMHCPGVRGAGGERLATAEDPALYWQDDFDFFWQAAFLSFVSDTGPRFCEVCGQSLDATTPKGRPSRRRTCGRCNWRRWWGKQPASSRRKKWRRDQRRKQGK
jgi:hypothetical protein